MVSAVALRSGLYFTDEFGLYRVVAVLANGLVRVENCWTGQESTKKRKELEEMRPVTPLASESTQESDEEEECRPAA